MNITFSLVITIRDEEIFTFERNPLSRSSSPLADAGPVAKLIIHNNGGGGGGFDNGTKNLLLLDHSITNERRERCLSTTRVESGQDRRCYHAETMIVKNQFCHQILL